MSNPATTPPAPDPPLFDFPCQDPGDPPTPAARARVTLAYAARMGRRPRLDRPQRFTEWVQRRKLVDRDPLLPILTDRLGGRGIVSDRLGSEWVVPTVWSGDVLPFEPPVSGRAMLKARHGCNQYRPISGAMDRRQWRAVRRQVKRWSARRYGRWLDEWAYRDVPRGCLIESWIGEGDALPVDYKIYVFGGAATHVQVHLERGGRHRWLLHDRDWRSLAANGATTDRPRSLDAMIEAAEALAGDMSFVRIDFFEQPGRPVFGEFCFYPGSGLDRFASDRVDLELGHLWSVALAAPALVSRSLGALSSVHASAEPSRPARS